MVEETEQSDIQKAVEAKRTKAASPEQKLAELKRRLLEISGLTAAGSLLSWDQATYMPKGGGATRGRHLALLSALAHEKSIDPALGKLLDDLLPYTDTLAYDSDEASLIRVARRDFERAIKVPAGFTARASAAAAASYDAWVCARPQNDFAAMRPHLEEAVELAREYAEFFAPYEHIADPLIEAAEEGMTAARVRTLFSELRRELLPIVQAICDQPAPDDSCLKGYFAETAQLDFSLRAARSIGYDTDRGRLDKTRHPFTSKTSSGDVRITARANENHFGDAFFSALHEAGHAIYEQSVAPALDGTPLGSGASAGVHESQSRLWENLIGRSLVFWEHFYPLLRDTFPNALGSTSLETFYRAVNKVERSLIRTDADEVTYNLHIMMRFGLELDLLEGRIEVKDLPEAWRARMQEDVGIAPKDDRDGCLQDVHWYCGMAGGAFQSYTIGNILSAQLYQAALEAAPDIPREIARGDFGALYGWLRENLYRHGRKFKPDELMIRAAGAPLSVAPYIAYLRKKYGELYALPQSGQGSKDSI